MSQSAQQLHEAAWTRPKVRHSKKRNPADVDAFNLREYMRCKETRKHWLDKSDQPGPAGQRSPTRVAATELAIRELPPVELAAYMAFDKASMIYIDQLEAETFKLLEVVAYNEKWDYTIVKGKTHPLNLIAKVIVQSWLEPSRYYKMNGNPNFSSFARTMKIDRKTWHSRWKRRYEAHRDIPVRWYRTGKYRLTGEIDEI